MKTFLSLTTIEQLNAQRVLRQLKQTDPELFLFKLASLETSIPCSIAEKIYRELGNIALGSGYGKISIYVKDGKIVEILGERSQRVDQPIDLKEALYVSSEFVSVVEVKEAKT